MKRSYIERILQDGGSIIAIHAENENDSRVLRTVAEEISAEKSAVDFGE